MKLFKNRKVLYRKILISVSGLFSAAFLTGVSMADVTIDLTPSQCSVSFSLPGGDGCDASQCSSISGCVCVSKGDFITWNLPNNEKFKLKFQGQSPFKDNCGKNFKQAKHQCKVKSEVTENQQFDYDVVLQNCANGTDPRIVIKKT
jgi:hypothetical protein